MIRSFLHPVRRLSAKSYWRRFKEYKNTDPIEWAWMSPGQRLIHVIRSTGYFVFIVCGIGVMGLAFNEVLKSTNESRLSWDIFDDAKKKLADNDKIKKVFGLPLNAYAQDSSDSRIRNSLGHSIQKESGGERLWMSFVVSGSRGKGYATVEKFKKNSSDEFEYVTLIVHAPFANQSIPIIDNRPVKAAEKVIGSLMEWFRSWSKPS